MAAVCIGGAVLIWLDEIEAWKSKDGLFFSEVIKVDRDWGCPW